jgi:hypothetical protein
MLGRVSLVVLLLATQRFCFSTASELCCC